ncbi:hypothetical protein EVG20_g1463 [Dentipellis fragilis]|uniref:RING-type domain-containing protein n=1 Tax=Dentipellis fragilis TaxID=205917 RepID=A0A4Y9Z9V0_9AGAM|nr:hypothetical protein EVG20_g1463 [Dentipellis fragilis]
MLICGLAGRSKLVELEDKPTRRAKAPARTKGDSSRSHSVARTTGIAKKETPAPDVDVLRKDAAASRKEMLAMRKEFERETKKLRDQLRQTQDSMVAREAKLEEKEAVLTEFVDTQVTTAAAGILQQLEDHFSCPLCLDIMTSPTMLSAYSCGHTFCGLCLAKWSFSLLHDCGAWHESIHCPFCRAPVIHSNTHGRRPANSCPFLPNRTAANIVEDLVGKLHAIAKTATPVAESSSPAGKKRKRVKSEPKETQLPTSLADWADNGQKRKDWLSRNKVGNKEISYVSKSWATLTAPELLEIKERLKLLEA